MAVEAAQQVTSHRGAVMKLVVGALVLLILVFAMTAGRVSGDDARSLVRDGAQLVDVRTTSEFAAGHIEGAINIPVHELGARASELSRDRPIVVYCRSGQRSARATRELERAGFSKVHDLGAMIRW